MTHFLLKILLILRTIETITRIRIPYWYTEFAYLGYSQYNGLIRSIYLLWRCYFIKSPLCYWSQTTMRLGINSKVLLSYWADTKPFRRFIHMSYSTVILMWHRMGQILRILQLHKQWPLSRLVHRGFHYHKFFLLATLFLEPWNTI